MPADDVNVAPRGGGTGSGDAVGSGLGDGVGDGVGGGAGSSVWLATRWGAMDGTSTLITFARDGPPHAASEASEIATDAARTAEPHRTTRAQTLRPIVSCDRARAT